MRNIQLYTTVMSTHTQTLPHALLAVFSFITTSVVLTTLVGYIDEGNATRYGTFGNYLSEGGMPPLSDYLLWSVLCSVFGLIGYYVLKRLRPETSEWTRIGLSVLLIPIFAVGFVALIAFFSRGF